MEADWEVDIGGSAPVIDAHWDGWVDLTAFPLRAADLPEAQMLPGFADALMRLNAAGSPVWTAKCDVWRAEPMDADELNAFADAAEGFYACYVDLLPRSDREWTTLDSAVDWCRKMCGVLREAKIRQCRVDLVVRQAVLRQKDGGLGTTAYVTACGASESAALEVLSLAVSKFAETVHPAPATVSSQLQWKNAGE